MGFPWSLPITSGHFYISCIKYDLLRILTATGVNEGMKTRNNRFIKLKVVIENICHEVVQCGIVFLLPPSIMTGANLSLSSMTVPSLFQV